jgi:hypothetical protein
MLVLLDLQPGRADLLDQARATPLLRLPHVGLAVDPVEAGASAEPLTEIGSAKAAEINSAYRWLADLTDQLRLPQKLFVIHQFRLSMIGDDEPLEHDRDSVQLLIHMDGQGPTTSKDETWASVVGAAPKGVPFGWKTTTRTTRCSPRADDGPAAAAVMISTSEPGRPRPRSGLTGPQACAASTDAAGQRGRAAPAAARRVRRDPGQLGPAGHQPGAPGQVEVAQRNRGAGIDRAHRAIARACRTFTRARTTGARSAPDRLSPRHGGQRDRSSSGTSWPRRPGTQRQPDRCGPKRRTWNAAPPRGQPHAVRGPSSARPPSGRVQSPGRAVDRRNEPAPSAPSAAATIAVWSTPRTGPGTVDLLQPTTSASSGAARPGLGADRPSGRTAR